MTLHDEALEWIASKVGGRVNHGRSGERLGRCIPDVIVDPNPLKHNSRKEFHEIESLNFSDARLSDYSKKYPNGYFMLPRDRRVLWIVLPKGTSKAFDSIRILEKVDFGFKEYRVVRRHKMERDPFDLWTGRRL